MLTRRSMLQSWIVLSAGLLAPGAFAQDTVLASGQFSKDPDLRCDILEAKRVTGGALTIRWRLVNAAAPGGGGLTPAAGKPIAFRSSWDNYFYIDPAQNKKYLILRDSAGEWIGEIPDIDLKPGEQRLMWAKFAAPPATSTKISIHISGFAPFEDVPVQ